jgi:hypothetical protein
MGEAKYVQRHRNLNSRSLVECFQHAPTKPDTLDLYFALEYSPNCFLCQKPMEKSRGDERGRSRRRAQSGQVINDETDQRENSHHLESRGWYN